MNRMAAELEVSRRDMGLKERLEKEMEIAVRIQTAILPRHVKVPRLDIAAVMIPSAEVGGDYYDIVPVPGGCWIGIGDVSGHGITAGLVMLMLQSTMTTLLGSFPDETPRALVTAANAILYRQIKHRLRQHDYVTFTLCRYREDGTLVFAGAHELIIVAHADGRPATRLRTRGTWLGARPDIGPFTTDSRVALEDGDVVVLFTDGVTEARNASGALFDIERLIATIEEARDQTAAIVRDRVVAAVRSWTGAQEDDVTLVVMRYRAEPGIPDNPSAT
jgi:sigma-B regulation protein RsbU (phosphoserine phosphatase)